MLGIDNKEAVEFVSTHDKGDDKTVFVMGNITNRDKLRIFGKYFSAGQEARFMGINEDSLEVAKMVIKEVKNFNGKDWEGFPEEVIDALNFQVLMEVVTKALNIAFEDFADVEKN